MSKANSEQATVVNLRKSSYDVYIGRPSKWGNPFRIGPDGTRTEVIDKYRIYARRFTKADLDLEELKGKRLGCFCHPLPCHGDVLAQFVNSIK